jgi:DNA-binding transcriptional LysR family regulator
MLTNDSELINWAGKGQRLGVSLGQLVTLLELCGSESVAALAPKSASHAVNYRQKLDRLEKALGIGRLTRRVGNATQPSELGRRVAGEVRLMLLELSRKSAATGHEMSWVFGAGDTWLQSVVIPTLARWPKGRTAARWQVTNLRTRVLCNAIREGRVHFGLLRVADLADEVGLERVRVFPGVGQCVVMSGAPPAGTLREAILWAIQEGHPLVQQGSSWTAFREILAETMAERILADLEPSVICETHPQAAGSVVNGRGWTMVPNIVARNIEPTRAAVWQITRSKGADDVALVVCSRVLEKLAGGTEAANALKLEIGLTISGVKK